MDLGFEAPKLHPVGQVPLMQVDPRPCQCHRQSVWGWPGLADLATILFSCRCSSYIPITHHSPSPHAQVMYGMDYVASERAEQQGLLRSALIDHVRRTPEALIVVEEYDKLDCGMRGFFRQFLENGAVGNVTLNKAIILLESNLGYLQLLGLLKASRSRAEVTAEQAQRVLKDLIFERWERQACEDRTDTLKMVGLGGSWVEGGAVMSCVGEGVGIPEEERHRGAAESPR